MSDRDDTPETHETPSHHDNAGAGSQAEQNQRIGKLESAVDSILAILDRDKDEVHDASQEQVAGKLDRPSNVADEIRAQLDERDRAQRDEADRKSAGDRLGALETKISELAETRPEPPQRRSERVMWGRR